MAKIFTSRKLIECLPIVEENVLVEASKQPQLFIEASRYRVEKFRQRGYAEMALETAEAQRSLKLRQARDDEGKKPTEGTIKAQIDVDPGIQALKKAEIDAQALEEFSKLIIEAFRKRSDALKILADSRTFESMHDESEINKLVRRKFRDRARDLADRRVKMGVDD